MAHQALARKYRPRNFAEVSTQEHVSETLRRAVAGGRVGHAYLFCGPRGVGKTTLARVLAMALNCPNRGSDGEPCGACDSCERIWGGHTALDVIEIDAASNRGVDDARDLRERAMYAPSEPGRHKIYIVDEAHMLTREAWNALLKILEEPPARVVFVFATTEPLKIQQSAAPILSRCQRFDFKRIGVNDIAAQLKRVLTQEGIAAPDDALRMVARKADGGMRDGLSLMDQVLALTGGVADVEAVRRVLGIVEEERYLELLDVLREARHAEVFSLVETLLDEGYDLVEFYHGLVDVLRGLIRIRLTGGAWTEAREDLRDAFKERADSFAAGDLVRMLALASELEANGSLRKSADPRLLLEMLLLRFSYLDRTVELEELLRAMGGAPGPQAKLGEAPPRGGSHSGGGEGAGPPPPSRPAPRSREPTSGGRALGAAPPAAPTLPAVPPVEPPDPQAKPKEGGAAPKPAAESLPTQASASGARAAFERAMQVGPDAPRITQEKVRQDRLSELIQKEPVLKKAVEELDLELLD